MFATTFVGHQGWMFATDTTRLLVDPLLTDAFGHAGAVGVVYPPRTVDPAAFPAVDAVLITHEHEDHFDVPTLNRLDRRIPILLSAASSSAARTILGEMGFTVRLVRGGQAITIGDLDVALFTPDHVRHPLGDEYDVVQYAVRDRGGHGSFASAVDCHLTAATRDAMAAFLGRIGLWCHTNNAATWTVAEAGESIASPPYTSQELARDVLRDQSELRFRAGAPAGTLFCGGGLAFPGDRAWLNRHVFPASSARVAEALRALHPGETILAPIPGQTVHMEAGAVVGVDASTPYLGTRERSAWPDREPAGEPAMLETYEPVSGRHDLSATELREVIDGLGDLAGALYGSRLFLALCSVDERVLEGRRAALGLVLLTGRDRESYVLEHDARECRFVAVDVEDPFGTYVTGLECWGTDLLGLLRGDFGPAATIFGRQRAWTHHPRVVPMVTDALWSYFHPLRRPASFLGLYRRLLGREPEGAPRVPAGRGSEIVVRPLAVTAPAAG